MVVIITLCNNLNSPIVIVDFTGVYNNAFCPENIEVLNKIARNKTLIFIGDADITWDNDVFLFSCDSTQDLQEIIGMCLLDGTDCGECDAIVITNNYQRISEWHQLNLSVIYLDVEEFKDLKHDCMPDEIWKEEDFRNFAESRFNNLSFSMERIGLTNATEVQSTYYKFMMENRITNVEFEVIFAGRYFKSSDYRQYINPLSRAILDFKFEVRNDFISGSRRAIFRLLNNLLLDIINDNEITLITAVPPRPGGQHRFYGFNNFYTGNVPLRFDLLQTIHNYPSPKRFNYYEEKYRCVEDVFSCIEAVEGHILLLDDIYTTGVTTSECVRMLLDAGASRVTVVPIAHTQAGTTNQNVMQGLFDTNGNEYMLKFNLNSGESFWVRRELPGYLSTDEANSKYINQNDYWLQDFDTNGYVPNPYDLEGIIFDLDNTLVFTDELEEIRFQSNFSEDDINFIQQYSYPLISKFLIDRLMIAGIKVGIVTRSKYAYANTVLNQHGFNYDVLISRYDCFRTKPFPDPFISCAKKLGVESSKILTIGNEQSDEIASKAAKMKSIKVLTQFDFEKLIQILEDCIKNKEKSF